MGTRADFYVGRGEKAEWLGSIAWDGHPGNFPKIERAKTERAFRAAVAKELAGRDDGTTPDMGWPWPWEDSHLTDYSYAFDDGRTYHTAYVPDGEKLPCPNCEYGRGKVWVTAKAKLDDDGHAIKHYGLTEFPNMKDRKIVAAPGSERSGVMVFGVRR